MTKQLIYLWLFAFSFTSFSQKSISGVLIDQKTKEPVSFAHVFLRDSSIGSFSNLDGYFYLTTKDEALDYYITISHVGYELLKTAWNTSKDTIELKLKTDQLADVEVSAKVDKRWRNEYEKFKNALLGTSEFADNCEILNPWVIEFSRVKGVLVATSEQALEISNNSLGYKILFRLDLLTIKNDLVSIKGHPINFSNLSEKKLLLKHFESRRMKAYNGSVYHFVQSLITNTLDKNGFEVFKVGNELVDRFHRKSKTPIPKRIETQSEILSISNNRWIINYDEFLQIRYEDPISGQIETSWIRKEGEVRISENGTIENMDNLKLHGAFANDRLANYIPKEELSKYHKDQIEVRALASQLRRKKHYSQNPKIHLHTDRDLYFAGDDIWIKGYILFHDSSTQSKKIFIELVGEDSSYVKTILPLKNSISSGHLSIPENIPENQYWLVAYLDQPISSNYHFKKPIQVGLMSSNKSISSTSMGKVSIYPEGGYLVPEVINSVAFQIQDRYGKSVDTEVTLYEGTTKILSSTTAWRGKGTFRFVPKLNQEYTLMAENSENIQPVKFSGDERKIGLLINPMETKYEISIVSNSILKDSIYVTSSSNGNVNWLEAGYLYKTYKTELPEEELEAGVNIITVFNSELDPILERAIYLPPVSPDINLATRVTNDSITVTFEGDSKIDLASISVVNLSLANERGIENILISKYLRPEIKGQIPEQEELFESYDKDKMELLMLVNGWRKPSSSTRKRGTVSNSKSGFAITGKVETKRNKIPNKQNIYLIPQDSQTSLLSARIQKNGTFEFENVSFNDSTLLMFTFDHPFRKKVISVSTSTSHDWKYGSGHSETYSYSADNYNERRKINFRSKYRLDSLFDESAAVLLDEVVVTSKERGSLMQRRTYDKAFAEIADFSDHPIHGDYRSLFNTLSRELSDIGYVFIKDNNSYFPTEAYLINRKIKNSGSSLASQNRTVTLFIDNSLTDASELLFISPSNVERAEYVKSRGQAGTLYIYTKSVYSKKSRKYYFENKLNGYAARKEFYIPTWHAENSNHMPTLYWNPKLMLDNKKFSFIKPQVGTPMKIIVEGLTTDSIPFRVVTFKEIESR